MFQTGKILFLYCETPLHAGSGEGGIIDLPIQREGHTDFPKIESSSLKGALRETMRGVTTLLAGELEAAFGSEKTENATRGALAFTDARLLLFPIRSAKGIFAWVTCRWALRQLQKDIALCPGTKALALNALEELKDDEIQIPASGCPLEHNGSVMLEEYVFKVKRKDALLGDKKPVGDWMGDNVLADGAKDFWKNALKKNVVIVPDEAFRDFASLHTEVVTRNAIDPDTGTVKDTGLFTEEYLPCDSVLYSVVSASHEFKDKDKGDGKPARTTGEIMTIFDKLPEVVQIGGNATIGKGLVRTARRAFNHKPSPEKMETDGAEKS